jgi:uncharacterized protein (TIGR00251 family)
MGFGGDSMAAEIKVRVLPRSSRNQLMGQEENVYKIKVTAAPVEGKANMGLIDFLSKKLDVPKKNIKITSGKRARLKRVRVQGLTEKDVHERLLL